MSGVRLYNMYTLVEDSSVQICCVYCEPTACSGIPSLIPKCSTNANEKGLSFLLFSHALIIFNYGIP